MSNAWGDSAFHHLLADEQDVTSNLAVAVRLAAVGCPIRLQRTSEPVWPDDEAQEAADLDAIGRGVPSLGDPEADAVLSAVTVALPDRLLPSWPRPVDGALTDLTTGPSDDHTDIGGENEGKGAEGRHADGAESISDALRNDLVSVRIPTSFSAPEDIVLRRLRLRIVLSIGEGETPVVVGMTPAPEVAVEEHEVAKFGVDFGKLAGLLIPPLADVFVARIGGTFDRTRVHPKVQTAGLLRHECSWRLSDPRLEYDFHPVLVAHLPGADEMRVLAELHVEVRKRILGVWHRTYGISAQPMLYVCHAGNPVAAADDYLEKLRSLQVASRTVLPYKSGDDASAAMDHYGRMLERSIGDPLAGGDVEVQWDDVHDAGHVDVNVGPASMVGAHEAETWYERAAQAGNVDAMAQLGALLKKRGAFVEAGVWYQRAADAGKSGVNERLSELQVERTLLEQIGRLQDAAAAGSSDAMTQLGRLHMYHSNDKAEHWLLKAAQADNDEAMLCLGELDEERERPKQAEIWYGRAARKGNTRAKRKLVQLHPWRLWYRLR